MLWRSRQVKVVVNAGLVNQVCGYRPDQRPRESLSSRVVALVDIRFANQLSLITGFVNQNESYGQENHGSF